MTTPFSSAHSCRRVDMTSPALIFGGLFVAAAVCGAMDASAPAASIVEEIQVARGELSVGPGGVDPIAMSCDREGDAYSRSSNRNRCLPKQVSGAPAQPVSH